MRNRTLLQTAPAIALFLLFNFVFGFSDDKKKGGARTTLDPDVCLEITGNLAAELKNSGGIYIVKLIQENSVIDSFQVDGKEKFKLHLKRNVMYTIKVEKNGFIPKLVSVSTQLPENVRKRNLYRFHFDIELFSDQYTKYFEADDIDFPVALISYDRNRGLFDYNKDYTAKVQSKMHTMSSR